MTRQCPICGTIGPPSAFPLLPQDEQPPRHDERRRRCLSCGHAGRAWLFRPPSPSERKRSLTPTESGRSPLTKASPTREVAR